MAQPQREQHDDVLEGIEDWISRRNAQTGDFARKAEAKGRQLWNDATRTGQNIVARTQTELKALGADQRPITPVSNGSAGTSWLDRSDVAKFLGGQIAEPLGQTAGVGRGAWHSVEGLGKGLLFGARYLNPESPEARAYLAAASIATAKYINKVVANPAMVGRDIEDAANRFYVGVDPAATPVAPTFTGEMARRYGIGLNQGELGWNVASLVEGTPALKAVEGLGALSDVTSAAKFAEMGFTDAQAARLALPYTGAGHHSVVSQSLAKTLGLPKWLRDSEFNVVKPDGMNQGDFYKLHFQVDPQYYGSGFSPKIGGPGWSGRRLGFQKYGPLNRFWYGTPTPLASVSAAAGAAGLENYAPSQDSSQ